MTPRDLDARTLNRAEGYLELGLFAHAFNLLCENGSAVLNRVRWHSLTGRTLLGLGRTQEALPHLELVYSLRPQEVDVAVSLGCCYQQSHRLAQAIGVLERVSKIAPRAAQVQFQLARYWCLAGNVDFAIERLRFALWLDPVLRWQIKEGNDFDRLKADPRYDRYFLGEELAGQL
jgi:tetratricopeptide (TPR) repeat protein